MSKIVLVTRPEPGAAATADMLTRLGHVPLLAPMLTITARVLSTAAGPTAAGPATHPPVQAVLITSANAIASMAAFDRALPVLAVGDATAARATQAGFARVTSAGRDAAALTALACAVCRPGAGPLLLPTGAGLGLDLARALRRHGFTVHRRVAYSARPATTLPPDAAVALGTGRIDAALFFSAASARAFLGCMSKQEGQVDRIEALAISHPTARALAPLPWRRIRVASHPNQDELVALLS